MKTHAQVTPRLISLIETASERAGNQSKLAELVEDTRHNLSAWKRGHRACPLEAQILMGAIAGKDVTEVMKDALLEQNEGTARGEKLKSALKKGLMSVGVVAVLTLCGIGDSEASSKTFHDVYSEFLRRVKAHFCSLRFFFC